jgi:hypothetical protein
LEAGAAFGESILYDTPRNATVITSSIVMLLRVEQKDFKILWEVNIINLVHDDEIIYIIFSVINNICMVL